MRRLRVFFVVLVCCSGATGIYGQGTLHVDGRAGTLVTPNIGQMPNISLSPGTYTVGVSGTGIKLFNAQPSPYRYIILWTANNNRHFFVEAGQPQTITFQQSPTTVFAFLVDVNNGDSSGELDVSFQRSGSTSTLHVDGRAGTLVVPNIGQMPNISLSPGTYTASVSGSGIRLFNAQPSPYRYIILWTANNNRHFFVEAGQPQAITFQQSPTTVFAFLVDVNNVDSSGELDVSFITVPPPGPTFPIALCKNVMESAAANCQAEASIDDGSFDPDGDPITLTQEPPGPYPLGSTEVTLTVTDDKGASAQCTGTVTVVDDTPPEVTADLILRELKENRPDDRGRGDFEVACTASDNCAGVTASGLMQIPAGFDDLNVEIEFDFKPGAESEINFHENKNGELSIQLEGADEVVLRTELADILAAGGVAVANGQLLDLRFRVRENKGQKFGFDFLNGVLVQEKVEGEDPQTITMLCTATDGSGNAAAGTSVDANFSPPSAAAKMGGVETFASENFGSAEPPEGFSLAQNYPNPFNPTTTITFAIPEAGEVTLVIYNMRGQLIQTLHSGVIAAGSHTVVWDSRKSNGEDAASGVYLVRLGAEEFRKSIKLVLLR